MSVEPRRVITITLFVVVLLVFPWSVSAQNGGTIDWPKYQDMAVDLMQQYLRVNTSNPPGNELEAAKFLKKVFDQNGIENEVFEFKPGRANIIARLKGNGSKRPILLLRSEERRVGKEWRSRWWLELGRKSEDEM